MSPTVKGLRERSNSSRLYRCDISALTRCSSCEQSRCVLRFTGSDITSQESGLLAIHFAETSPRRECRCSTRANSQPKIAHRGRDEKNTFVYLWNCAFETSRNRRTIKRRYPITSRDRVTCLAVRVMQSCGCRMAVSYTQDVFVDK